MKNAIWIPEATRQHLAQPAQQGERHRQIVKIAVSLASQGINPEAIFHQLRPLYGADVPDSEIRAVINWAMTKTTGIPGNAYSQVRSPKAFNARKRFGFPGIPTLLKNGQENRISPRSPESEIERYLSGFHCDTADLWERSPIRPPEDWRKDAETLLTALYRPEERLNIVSTWGVSNGKAHPVGTGKTKTVSEWLADFAENGPPTTPAGVWVRPNPVSGSGITDSDVSAFRFLLIEADCIPISYQVPFFARLPLPISAVISSGGKSLHAWVKMDAKTLSEFKPLAGRIYSAIANFGIDLANKNPSRLSRLPGTTREIGGTGEKRQKLLFLSPEPSSGGIIQ